MLYSGLFMKVKTVKLYSWIARDISECLTIQVVVALFLKPGKLIFGNF